MQLRAFQNKTRTAHVDATMQDFSKIMSDEDMLAIAGYVSKQRWPRVASSEVAPATLETGASLVKQGGCDGCHVNEFKGYGINPRLAGQSRSYLTVAISQLHAKERVGIPGMAEFVDGLTVENSRALAAYLETKSRN